MKNEKEIFELYVDLQSVMNAPFIQDGFVYATNGQVLIRTAKSETNGTYAHSQTPKCSSVFIYTNKELVITARELEKLLSEVEQEEETRKVGEDIECRECKGTGEVTWEYERWTKEDECPVCDGSGYSSQAKYVPTGKMIPNMYAPIHIGDKTFKSQYVITLLKTMNLMGVSSVVMKYNEGEPYEQVVFNFNINTDVLIMPYVN